MTKKNNSRKDQRQFLFVFNNLSGVFLNEELARSACEESACKDLSEDQRRAHRDRLIADLREFGC